MSPPVPHGILLFSAYKENNSSSRPKIIDTAAEGEIQIKKKQRYIRYVEGSTSPDAALAAHCDCESWDSLRASKSTTRPVDFCGCLEFDEDASFHRKWDLGRGDVASCPATEIFIPATAFPTKLNAFSHNELEGDTSLIPKSLVDQVSA